MSFTSGPPMGSTDSADCRSHFYSPRLVIDDPSFFMDSTGLYVQCLREPRQVTHVAKAGVAQGGWTRGGVHGKNRRANIDAKEVC